MSEQSTPASAELSTANVKQKSRKVSPVWFIPIIAAIIGGWMVFQKALEEKLVVEVTFKNASGIEAGKTVVKLRNITLGKVTKVDFTKDLTSITVTIEFKNIKTDRFTDTMRFWVVKPRIGVGGVTGLETLLSGAYIEIDPGEGGKSTREFVGLEEPGNYQLGNPGTSYTLESDKLGSLQRGSPVKFRDIAVGEVLHHHLAKDNDNVEIEIFVHAPYDKLIEPQTRFWTLSGFKVDIGAEGLKVNMESVATLMSGGVGFSTDKISTNPPSKEGDIFRLYGTENPEIEERVKIEIPLKLYFVNGVNGLIKGAPVEYKGLRFGTVDSIGVEESKDKKDILTFAIIDIEPDRLPGEHGLSNATDKQRIDRTYTFFKDMVKRGLRAQLTTGSLLTGKSLVTLDFFPDTKKETLKFVDGMPILPTVPETLVGIMEKVNKILDRMDDVPMEEIGNSISKAALSVSNLADSLDDGGALADQTREVMEELRRTVRSLRGLSSYLERHPEALLQGKDTK